MEEILHKARNYRSISNFWSAFVVLLILVGVGCSFLNEESYILYSEFAIVLLLAFGIYDYIKNRKIQMFYQQIWTELTVYNELKPNLNQNQVEVLTEKLIYKSVLRWK